MGELKSNVRELAAKKGLTQREFEGQCYSRGLALDTARRLWNEETGFNTSTLYTVSEILDVGIGDLFTKNGSH